MILPLSASGGVRRGSGGGHVRVSPYVRCSHNPGSPLCIPVVAGYEWVRDAILKYKSSLTFAASVATLQCQVKLASPEDSYKLVVQACGSDDFSLS